MGAGQTRRGGGQRREREPGLRHIDAYAPRSVPHEIAERSLPAYALTAYAWRRFLAMSRWTWATTSGRIGAASTAGRGTEDEVAAPDRERTVTVGRAAAIID